MASPLYPLLGFGCFILALVFMYVIWPRPKAGKPRSFGKNLILHYFHPLAWVLVGMAAFISSWPGSAYWSFWYSFSRSSGNSRENRLKIRAKG